MIVLFNTNGTHNPNSYLTLAVLRSLQAMLGPAEIVLADNRSLLGLAASGQYDTLICIDGQRLNQGLVRRARNGFRATVLWVFEDPFMLEYNQQSTELFDVVFTNDPSCVEFYHGKGHYLPLAAEASLHHREILSDERLRYDIFFAGTMWPNRVPIIAGLLQAFPRASFKLVCTVNDYLPPLPPEIADRAITRPINHASFIDFSNQSRAVVTLFRDYASHGDASQATAPGPRLFEVGYAGTAQVVDCGEMPRQYFSHTDGIALVSDAARLIAEIGAILDAPAERRDRAERAQRSIAAHHTYENRLTELLGTTRTVPRRQGFRREQPARKLRVLMCTHSTIHNHVWGGVEVFQQTLATALAGDVETFFWLRQAQNCRLLDADGRVLESFEVDEIGWLDVLSERGEEAAFSDVVAGYEIDVAHFQHLGHHAASLPIIAKAAGLGVIFSVHDFFLVCSRYNLLDYEQRYCRIDERSISACNICLQIAEGLPAGVQQQRRLFLEQMLASVDTLLFGTEHSRTLLERIYPQTASMRRLMLGIPMPVSAIPDRRPRDRPSAAGQARRLVVAIVGNFIRTKGADTVIAMLRIANPALFEFRIYGEVDAHYRATIERDLPTAVKILGRFAPGDLALDDAEVALHLSIWPETFCISLSEIWSAGLIPIVTDLGALGDRVAHGVNGFKVAVNNASGVIDTLELLRVSPALRSRIQANIGPHLWGEAAPDGAALLAEYRAIAPKASLEPARLSLDIGQLHLLPKRSWREMSPPRHIFDPPRAMGAMVRLAHVVRDWVSIQGSEFYLDKVCGFEKPPGARDERLDRHEQREFSPLSEFSIQGWTFVPNTSVAGQIVVCLIARKGDNVVFIEAERAARTDVMSIFPSAPSRSGFTARTRLSGKWSDGDYLIGVINLMGEKAAFQLSPRSVQFYEGKVVRLGVVALDNEVVLAAFASVFARTAGGDDLAAEPVLSTAPPQTAQPSPPAPDPVKPLEATETEAPAHDLTALATVQAPVEDKSRRVAERRRVRVET